MFSFGLTWSAYQWLIDNGIVGTFNIIGSVQIAVCLLSIPMCKVNLCILNDIYLLTLILDVLGKKNRAFFHRHDILKLLRLR